PREQRQRTPESFASPPPRIGCAFPGNAAVSAAFFAPTLAPRQASRRDNFNKIGPALRMDGAPVGRGLEWTETGRSRLLTSCCASYRAGCSSRREPSFSSVGSEACPAAAVPLP